jgi:hypothetical protein
MAPAWEVGRVSSPRIGVISSFDSHRCLGITGTSHFLDANSLDVKALYASPDGAAVTIARNSPPRGAELDVQRGDGTRFD